MSGLIRGARAKTAPDLRAWSIEAYVPTPIAGEAGRFAIFAPVGLRVCAAVTRPAPLIYALAPRFATKADHAFWIAPIGVELVPPLGRKLGAAWPVTVFQAGVGDVPAFIVEDLPWPVGMNA